MRIYKYVHSCLLIEEKGKKILIDPGTFSFMDGAVSPDEFSDVAAVIVTHAHADHVDAAALKTILKKNNAAVVSNAGVAELLRGESIPVSLLENDSMTIDGFLIEAVAAEHERVLGPLPRNTAYRINKKLVHPGDSMNDSILAFRGTPVLALPTIAPWSKRFEVVEFAEKMAPEVAIPIHDAFIKEFFERSQNEMLKKYFADKNINYRPLVGKDDFWEI